MQLISEPDRKNQVLASFAQHKDEKRLMLDCYMWTLEPQVWQDIGILNYPQPPKEWVEYENLNFTQKAKLGEDFFHQMAIKEYLSKRGRVYSHNQGHWEWLKDMSKFFPRDNENATIHYQIDQKLDEFSAWFSGSTPAVSHLKNIFDAKEDTWPNS